MSTKKFFLYLLVIALAIVPFFWLKPGEINLGGDSSRGYLYQPYQFITNYVLYGLNAWNIGTEMVGYFVIPFSAFLGVIYSLVKTSHNLVNLFNSFSLVFAFLGTYASIYSIIVDSQKEDEKSVGFARTAGIIGGLFYIFSPTMTNWDKPLLTFNQIFLHPVIFYFLYKYFNTKKLWYGIVAILITFVFAPNFSFIGAPTFFSFYPFVFFFFIVWVYFIKRSSLNFKQIILLILFFLGMHSFHLIPQILSILNPSSIAAGRIYSDPSFNYVTYFKSIANGVDVANNFLGLPQFSLSYGVLFFIFPFIIIVALLQKVKNDDFFLRKQYLLLVCSFLLLLFFTSGKITKVGLLFYASLFYLPGFGMFRNFNGQFMTAFSFFYALVIGCALYILFKNWKKVYSIGVTLILFALLLVRGWPLLNGSMMYLPVFQSKVSTPFMITKSFEKALSTMTNIKTDSKILALPLTDFGYLMIPGQHGGLFIGSSIIGPLTLHQDFGNYTGMGGLGNTFIQAVKVQDTKTVNNVLSLLNIQDVFWEKDPFIYHDNFPSFPFESTRNYIPTTVSAYQSFINTLPTTNTITFDKNMQLLHLDPTITLPKIFPSTSILYTDNSSDIPYFDTVSQNRPIVALPNQAPFSKDAPISYETNAQEILSPLYDNLQFHKAIPESSWKPGSIFYPFVIWKEKSSLKKQQRQDKMTFGYLYLAKRIDEIDKWTYNLQILHHKVTLPNSIVGMVLHPSSYGNWEALLSIYEEYGNQIIADANTYSQYEISGQKLQILEQFEQHRERLLRIINSVDTTFDNKSYLVHIANGVFDRLETNLALEKIDMSKKNYTFILPKGADGTYALHLSRLTPDTQYTSLQFEGNSYQAVSGNGFSSFGNVVLASQRPLVFTLAMQPKNLALDSKWRGAGLIGENNGVEDISIDNSVNTFTETMTRQVPLVTGKQQYIVSFLYNTRNVPFGITLLDKRINGQGHIDSFVYATRQLLSSDWKLYQTVFTLDPTTKAAYIELNNLDEDTTHDILLKDFTVTAVESPILKLEKVNTTISSGPSISFQRINPTKYRIFVSNAKDPYVLTFLQAFSKSWKLYYIPSHALPTFPLTQVYFNGQVSEGGHTNIVLSKDTPETWNMKPIAQDTHVVGEGYANSWIITPADTQGNTSYELIIELRIQKFFYIGSIITSISILIAISSLLWFVIKRRGNDER